MIYAVVITAMILVLVYDAWREEKLYQQGKDLIRRMEDLDG